MRLGILGGGQLAWMLAQAAEPLGVSVAVLDPSPDCAAGRIADHVVAAYDDPAGLDEVSKGADVVTYEFENVPAAAVTRLAEHGMREGTDARPRHQGGPVRPDRLGRRRRSGA